MLCSLLGRWLQRLKMSNHTVSNSEKSSEEMSNHVIMEVVWDDTIRYTQNGASFNI